MKIVHLLFIYILFTGSVRKPNNTQYVKKQVLKIQGLTSFTLDHLDNLYTANSKGDVVKYDKNGEQTATSNHKALGNIHSIDAGNPFEVYVFYKAQNKVLFFDNQLNDRGFCDFEDAGFFMLSAAARSFDNKIWVFDLADLKLKKIRKDLSVELSSGNVREFSNVKNFDPSYIGDLNKTIYVFNPGIGIFEFDIFCNFKRAIRLEEAEQVVAANGKIYYLKSNQIYEMEMLMLRDKPLQVKELPEKIDAFAVSAGKLAVQSGNELILYALN
jgi:hypothetical protein